MRKSLILLVLVSALFHSCMKETELKKSVFIYDPENTELPAYSEWGYNTFGAYYDREVFVSNNKLVPAKILVSDTAFSFFLNGQNSALDYYNAPEMFINFTISGFTPQSFADLALLNDSIIDLSQPDCHVFVSIDTVNYSAVILNGALNFMRVQILKVDNQQVEAILSGHFDFRAIIKNKPVTVSEGRFDVGIGVDNFYVQ